MSHVRSFLPFLTVALLAMFVAACGSENPDSSDATDGRDAGSTTASTTDPEVEAAEPEPGSEAAVEVKTGVSSFASTPALESCMTTAGFRQDSPAAAGGVASWTHTAGSRVVIAPSSETALTVAGEIGTTDAPADVDGVRVTTGAPALAAAATACLDA